VGKNIVVFSDGTGQDGAVRLDARLSNVYKLYRASRIGPDTSIDPSEQIAFYDPGLGTDADSQGFGKASRALYKMWASIAGRGIGTNIADCYEFIINHWQPGDRIFIFGFSRGAYTARCVAQVLSLCGVPTQGANDKNAPFRRFGRAARQVAERAVHQVYEHGAGYERARYEGERDELARRFRVDYGSDLAGAANAYPYFIGVFDTVASLGAAGFKRYGFIAALAAAAVVAVAAVAGVAYWLPAWLWWRVLAAVGAAAILVALGRVGGAIVAALLLLLAGAVTAMLDYGMDFKSVPFWWGFGLISAIAGLSSLTKLQRDSHRFIDDFPPGSGRKSHHIRWKAANYDRGLSAHVGFARHATAIDETRADFDRLGWGNTVNERPKQPGEPDPFIQLYFGGNHSDIGGSYPEPESRLSDVALQWMLDEATSLSHPLIVETARLQSFPDPAGLQHNEPEAVRENTLWWVPNWAPQCLKQGWAEKDRKANGFQMHPSVFQRFAAKSVGAHGAYCPYRPHNLRNDRRFAWAYNKLDLDFNDIVSAQRKAACDAGGVKIVLGKAEKPLADLLKAQGATSAVGIFPGNPRPNTDSEYLDALALKMFNIELGKYKLKSVPLSRTAVGATIVEHGLLVFDIADADARHLAMSFGAMTIIRVNEAGLATLADITPELEKEPQRRH
jgi:uncharacterized protein (DUF2235 family)